MPIFDKKISELLTTTDPVNLWLPGQRGSSNYKIDIGGLFDVYVSKTDTSPQTIISDLTVGGVVSTTVSDESLRVGYDATADDNYAQWYNGTDPYGHISADSVRDELRLEAASGKILRLKSDASVTIEGNISGQSANFFGTVEAINCEFSGDLLLPDSIETDVTLKSVYIGENTTYAAEGGVDPENNYIFGKDIAVTGANHWMIGASQYADENCSDLCMFGVSSNAEDSPGCHVIAHSSWISNTANSSLFGGGLSVSDINGIAVFGRSMDITTGDLFNVHLGTDGVGESTKIHGDSVNIIDVMDIDSTLVDIGVDVDIAGVLDASEYGRLNAKSTGSAHTIDNSSAEQMRLGDGNTGVDNYFSLYRSGIRNGLIQAKDGETVFSSDAGMLTMNDDTKINGNLLGLVSIIKRAGTPSTPEDGMLYYETGTEELRLRKSGAWVNVLTT
jgi:hypothetical protein